MSFILQKSKYSGADVWHIKPKYNRKSFESNDSSQILFNHEPPEQIQCSLTLILQVCGTVEMNAPHQQDDCIVRGLQPWITASGTVRGQFDDGI